MKYLLLSFVLVMCGCDNRPVVIETSALEKFYESELKRCQEKQVPDINFVFEGMTFKHDGSQTPFEIRNNVMVQGGFSEEQIDEIKQFVWEKLAGHPKAGNTVTVDAK